MRKSRFLLIHLMLQGKRVALSGSGNVATYAVEKLLELGAVPVTVSDSSGYIYFEVRRQMTREPAVDDGALSCLCCGWCGVPTLRACSMF